MMSMRSLLLLLAIPAIPAIVQAQTPEQKRAIAGDPVARPQRLVLMDIPKPVGRSMSLFNGRDLDGWTGWLGYPDPSVTYEKQPAAEPIGTGRDMSGDFAVKQADGAPALWVNGRTWGSLVHKADLRNYHLRMQYKWGARTWAPRLTEPRNNGLLYHSHGRPGAVFGTWSTAVEFEIMDGSVGMLVPVGGDVRARTTVAYDPTIIYPHRRYRVGGRDVDVTNSGAAWNVEAATDAERPVGQWNTLDLYVVGDRAVHVVNGVPVMVLRDLATIDPVTGARRPLTHGAIQLQSEGAETWFRNITLVPIAKLPRIVVARAAARG